MAVSETGTLPRRRTWTVPEYVAWLREITETLEACDTPERAAVQLERRTCLRVSPESIPDIVRLLPYLALRSISPPLGGIA